MTNSLSRNTTAAHFSLLSARSLKRWARGLLFVWFGMWLSAALLHCEEVEAAAHEHGLSADCEYPARQAPDTGAYKKAACLLADEPAPASVARLLAPTGGNLSLSLPPVSALFRLLPPLAAPSLPPAYGAAPPPVAVYLRSLRLLI
jgi:hypothetical protein